MKIRICIILALLLQFAAAKGSHPNFIIIYMDDLGYNDLGVFGSPNIETPRLDNMAAEGARFTDFYSAHNICSASRAAVLTGQYPKRTGVNGVLWPEEEFGFNPHTLTIADILKRKGYSTAAVGKWHLGILPKFLPMAHGFDSYYGIPFSNDMYMTQHLPLATDILLNEGFTLDDVLDGQQTIIDLLASGGTRNEAKQVLGGSKVPMVRNQEVVEFPVDQTTITRRFTDEAISYITTQAGAQRPFFLYLAHSMPHIPLFASEDFAGSNPTCEEVGATRACGLYADVIEEVDFNVGRLLDAVKSLGIDSNTLVVFTSDNGPWDLSGGRGGLADPFRGFKFQTWEGGHREPTVMRWPGNIPAGLVQSAIGGTIDLLPTFAALAGVELPLGQDVGGTTYKVDGLDIFDMMTGQPGASRSTPYFYQGGSTFQGVRVGNFKLRLDKLYDLENDPHEDTDINDADMKAELQGLIDDITQEINDDKFSMGQSDDTDPQEGCTNPDASNYNSSAFRDDGSCILPLNTWKIFNLKEKMTVNNSFGEVVVTLPYEAAITVKNLQGKTLLNLGAAIRHVINKSELSNGVFFLTVNHEKITLSKKFVLQ